MPPKPLPPTPGHWGRPWPPLTRWLLLAGLLALLLAGRAARVQSGGSYGNYPGRTPPPTAGPAAPPLPAATRAGRLAAK